jgi:hypothetical protein
MCHIQGDSCILIPDSRFLNVKYLYQYTYVFLADVFTMITLKNGITLKLINFWFPKCELLLSLFFFSSQNLP